jgi:SAM-dependent methyltransferase
MTARSGLSVSYVRGRFFVGPLLFEFVPSRWCRRLRRLLGRGWDAADFAERYARGEADAWGYRHSPQHLRRVELIVAALPKERFARALEAGCAQGFLTERLAVRVDHLLACDISAAAVDQARENCRGSSNVEFRVADIRDVFPGDVFDLCVFSDVLYYLAPREVDGVLAEAGRRTAPGGHILIVNEWTGRAQNLTPPSYAFARLDASPLWRRTHLSQTPWGDAELSLAVYQRG